MVIIYINTLQFNKKRLSLASISQNGVLLRDYAILNTNMKTI